MKFNLCCERRTPVAYEITHKPKPKEWDKDLLDSIQMLLWYIPNIDSVQSKSSSLIKDKAYDNAFFSYILEELQMTEGDVKFLDQGEEIDRDTWNFYRKEICTSCQKIILVRRPYNTKTENLLRCIRNAVAHGDFNVVGDMFIGFNEYKGQRNAIIKVKPERLVKALDITIAVAEYTKEIMVADLLERSGFEVSRNQKFKSSIGEVYQPDIIAKKDGQTYIIEFKILIKEPYIHPDRLEKILKKKKIYRDLEREEDIKYVLILDKTRLTKASWDLVERKKNLKIMDLNKLKSMSLKIR